MRLLLIGESTDTGFGVVTKSLAEQFLGLGHDVRILAGSHRGNPVKGPLAGRIWPGERREFGGFDAHLAITGALFRKYDASDDWVPQALLIIADMSGLVGHIHGRYDEFSTIPVYHYCPIEGDNLPPQIKAVWDVVKPVAMSDYGQQVISSYLGRHVPRIYHGIEPEYKPLPIDYAGVRLRTKADCRAALGLPLEGKLILRTDRLVQRKFYDRFLAAMCGVMAEDPSVSVVIHCKPVDLADDLNLFEELGRFPEQFQKRFILTGAHDTWQGLPTEGMVALMNAADLYVSTSGGEGFGLNLAESLACEVPVVVTGWAAEVEVVGPGGTTVPPLTDSYGETVRFHSKYGMDWAVPDDRAFVQPVLELLKSPARRKHLGELGRRHVVRSFRWDVAATQFSALFEEADASVAV